MPKNYSDRSMANKGIEEDYFFPKHVPPVTIRAKSRAEAEEKLKELDNTKNV